MKFLFKVGVVQKKSVRLVEEGECLDAFEGDTEPLEGIKLSEQDAVRRFRRKAENVILKWTDDVI